MRWWTIVKDILLTGTGVVLVLSQVFARSPSDILLVTGLALTAPSVAGHAKALLTRPGAAPSSPPPPSPGASQPSPPQEATGE